MTATTHPENDLAAQKLASGFFRSEPTPRARPVAAQVTSTHLESVTYIYKNAPGCAVDPNSAAGEAKRLANGEVIGLRSTRNLTPGEAYQLSQTIKGVATLRGDPMLENVSKSLSKRDFQIISHPADQKEYLGVTFGWVPSQENVIYLNPSLFQKTALMLSDSSGRSVINWPLFETAAHEDVHLRLARGHGGEFRQSFTDWQHSWIPGFENKLFDAILHYTPPPPPPPPARVMGPIQ